MTKTMERIRVLMIAPSMEIMGGQSIQAQRLLAELRQEPSIEVAFLPFNPTLPAWLGRIRYVRTISRLLLYWPALLWTIPRFDIVHVFSASYWSSLLFSAPPLLVGRLFGKKTILNYRSGEAEDHLRRWRTAIPTVRLATVTVAPSPYLVDVFARFGLKSRAIWDILDAAPFRYRARKRLRPVFLSNRGLEALYNVACILRAFRIIQDRYPEASLTVAHDGPCRARLEALARELELRNTTFVGRVPHEKAPDLYDDADIYLASPNLDCIPGSLLEAFASGLPVVATKAGGIPYIAEHERTALLVDLDDSDAMAACALRLLEDEALVERMTANARAECGKYDGGPVRIAWTKLYHELMGENA